LPKTILVNKLSFLLGALKIKTVDFPTFLKSMPR